MATRWKRRERLRFRRVLEGALIVGLLCGGVLGLWASGGHALDLGEEGPAARGAPSDKHLAYRYMTVGWLDWAAMQLADVVNKRPDVESLIVLGMLLDELEDDQQAVRAYEQAIQMAADDPRTQSAALTLLGNLHWKAGRTGSAKEAFQKALELSETNAQALFGMGRIAEDAGRDLEAIEWYERAAQAAPEWIEPVVRAASLLNGQGDFGRAAVLLKEASHLGIWHAEYHFQLALSYEGLLSTVLAQGVSPELAEKLEAIAIAPDEPGRRLKEHALHAVDRVKQLDAQHPGLESLLHRLQDF